MNSDSDVWSCPLAPCPWCRKTPQLVTPVDESTWCWTIKCSNYQCLVRPKAPNVCIRKTQKTSIVAIEQKLVELFRRWNQNNPFLPFEAKVIKYSSLNDLINKKGNFCE
jgi:hypothetical protein